MTGLKAMRLLRVAASVAATPLTTAASVNGGADWGAGGGACPDTLTAARTDTSTRTAGWIRNDGNSTVCMARQDGAFSEDTPGDSTVFRYTWPQFSDIFRQRKGL